MVLLGYAVCYNKIIERLREVSFLNDGLGGIITYLRSAERDKEHVYYVSACDVSDLFRLDELLMLAEDLVNGNYASGEGRAVELFRNFFDESRDLIDRMDRLFEDARERGYINLIIFHVTNTWGVEGMESEVTFTLDEVEPYVDRLSKYVNDLNIMEY